MQQHINHVDHVCFIYRRENFEKAKDQFTKALGITDWNGPQELPYFGVLQAQSLSTGIEILTPLIDGTPFDDYLRERGEGFLALIYGVADVHKAAAEAQANGIQPIFDENGKPVLIDALTIDNGKPAYADWPTRLKRYLEIPLQPVCGVNMYFGEIVPAQKG